MNKVLATYLCLFALSIFSIPFIAISSEDNTELEDWFEINEPLVKNYLKSLTSADKDKIITGIKLSDGSVLFKGYKYLGQVTGLGIGVHLYLFSVGNRNEAAVWIDSNGKELPIPECPQDYPGEGQYVISGDVYTWKAVQPNHGPVLLECLDEEWLTKAR